MFHKSWSRDGLLWFFWDADGKDFIRVNGVGGNVGREPDKAMKAIRLQSKSDFSKERGREDWVQASQNAMHSKESSAKLPESSGQSQPSKEPMSTRNRQTICHTQLSGSRTVAETVANYTC